MAGFRFIFTIFIIAVLLISAVHLRNYCDRTCYLIYSVNAEQSRLKQQLWQKQLRLEGYLNPTSVNNTLQEE
jgi:hypothetical protein